MNPLRHRFLYSALCVLASLVGLTSCAKRETAVEEGIRTQTLHVGNAAEPGTLDPHLSLSTVEQRVQVALFEGLTAFDEKTTRAVPAAAERWETSTDGLTWTFHLRAGLLWSNGEPLTADDFVQSWRRALAPAVANPEAYLFSAVKNADAFNAGKLTDPTALGFAAPDTRTVVITLAQPTPILPLFAATPFWYPVNPRVLARFDGLGKRAPAWTRPENLVGNGPFTLTEWKPNARIVVTKNPRHWDTARTALERVIFYPIESSDVEEHNFRAGQLHLTSGLPAAKVAAYRERSPELLRLDPEAGVEFLVFNTLKPPLDNAKVRRALSLGINREAIARAVYHGSQVPAHSLVPVPCGDYVSRARISSDFEAARRLLAEAGFPGGRGVPVMPLVTYNAPGRARFAEALQAIWKKELGVEITIALLESKTMNQNQQAKDFTIAYNGWIGDFADPFSFLAFSITGDPSNSSSWSNPAFDRLMYQATHTPDATARLEYFQQAETILLEESPLAPVIYSVKTYLKHPAVRGWEPAQIGLHRYQLIRLEK